jgi:hypothetical protein
MFPRIIYSVVVIVLVSGGALTPLSASGQTQTITGRIYGQVVDDVTGEGLPGASVAVVQKFAGAIADQSGGFRVSGLPVGAYTLRVSYVGYETVEISGISVSADSSEAVLVRLTPRPPSLKTIVVTPGQFNIMASEAVTQQALSRREIATVPQLGDDFFRAVNRLPGVSGNDFSTRFTVRGGEYDEVLVALDGLEIYEPFHLKDIDGGAMSIIDVAAVDGIDLMTGGFPSLYGEKMSGVFNIRSRTVSSPTTRLSAGLSMMNARGLAYGPINAGRGSWLVSLRRGYIDYVLKLAGADDEIKPTYYDAFAKLRYRLNERHLLAAHILHAGDDLEYKGQDEDLGDTLLTDYGNSYAWITLWSDLSPTANATTVASVGSVTHNRWGNLFAGGNGIVTDRALDNKDFRFVGLKSDLEIETSPDLLLRLGFDTRKMWCDYDYLSEQFSYTWRSTPTGVVVELDNVDSTEALLEKSGDRTSMYLSARHRLSEVLTAEVGARYDDIGYTGGEHISPRASFVYSLGPRSLLRASWGKYYQSQGIDEIAVGDGQTDFFPAERAEQRMLGLEHRFENGTQLRLEAYYKEYKDLRPDFRNSFDDIEAFPEVESDRSMVFRNRSVSKGIELFLKRDMGGRFSWWTSYALANIEDDIDFIYFPNDDAYGFFDTRKPSPNDQRHTFYLDVNYRPSPSWQLNLALQVHSGWPYTDVYMNTIENPDGSTRYYLQAGEQWGARHDVFSRLDFRVNRYFGLWGGRVNAFVELINVLDHGNVRSYDYSLVARANSISMVRDPEYWFGRLPSVGFSYEVDL